MAVRTVVEAWSGPGRRDGVIAPLAQESNAAHPTGDKHGFEHWYFDAALDDGHIVVAFLQTRELVSRKAGVELHIYSPDGSRREIIAHYPDDQVSAAADHAKVRIGENTAEAFFDEGELPVHRVHLAEEDVVFDLAFHSEVPGWMPGRGRTTYGDREFFAWAVGAPRAKVTGTVRIGDRVIEASGRGYHDHNWGIGDMKRIIDRWYWGRLYVDDFTLVYATVLTQKAYGAHWATPLMLARGGEIVLSTGELEVAAGPMRYHPDANREYPSSLRLTVPGQVDLLLEVQEIVHAHDFLADVPIVRSPLVKPLVNKMLGRPGYFRFRSHFTLTVTVDGECHTRTGTTLHEMVALK